tara:strand:- start:417 stop:602 length:186 start_codon:yes stop_codon:yes gene_type:complete
MTADRMHEDFWHLDKNKLKKSSSTIYGSFRTASPQRQTKRELRRQQLKQQRQAKPQARGFV